MKLRRLTNVVVVTVILLALNLSSGASATATISVNTPCGSVATTTYTHVVWIMLENQGYSVVGSPSAPYFNELSDQCGLATNYYAISHPSLPNYVALTSGSPQGITDDGEPNTHLLATGLEVADARRVDAQCVRQRDERSLRGSSQSSGLLHRPQGDLSTRRRADELPAQPQC